MKHANYLLKMAAVASSETLLVGALRVVPGRAFNGAAGLNERPADAATAPELRPLRPSVRSRRRPCCPGPVCAGP